MHDHGFEYGERGRAPTGCLRLDARFELCRASCGDSSSTVVSELRQLLLTRGDVGKEDDVGSSDAFSRV